ncbi:hypothetical protein CBS101457_003603 [Exobasidium rhododendri]|nr:hypothetical protein CBS101457_003603 [Exobasidium rhododendri]
MSPASQEDGPGNGGLGRSTMPSSLSLAIQQRKRSHSNATPNVLPSSNPHPRHRQRTNTGPMSSTSQNTSVARTSDTREHIPVSPVASFSASRFVTSSTAFHLPQRALVTTPTVSSHCSSSLGSPTFDATGVIVGDGPKMANASLPLLRRKAAVAALAHASRKNLRRGSMLGKEVANDYDEHTGSEEGEEDADMEEYHRQSRVKQMPPMINEEQDDDMQIDTGDVTVAGVELDGMSRDSNSPSNVEPNGRGKTPTAARRGVQRRANHMPKDRGVLRVAATLRDETRPGDGEIASEAKLQRRLGPESDSQTPTTPKLLAYRSQSPFEASSAGPIDRTAEGDDFYFPDGTHFEMSDDSDYDGDDDMTTAKNSYYIATDGEGTDRIEAGIAIPGTSNATIDREKLWLNFRESSNLAMNNPRLSPSTERTFSRNRGQSIASTGGANAATPLSGSLGSTLEQAMDLEAIHQSGSSPSLWGRTAKRKMGDDRFEPYSSSVLHKRRAISPIAFVSAANNGKGRGRSCTPTSTQSPGLGGLNQMSPLSIQVPFSSATTTNLPTPTPLSIPSPTLPFSRGSGFSGSFPRSYPGLPMSRSGRSANPSPSTTRPTTPTNQVPSNPYGPGPSPSLLSSSASKASILSATMGGPGGQGGGVGAAGAAGGGSGPGYGSGALGLSLGGGSKRYKEEQEEKEEEEGILGDVSAIKLGEL